MAVQSLVHGLLEPVWRFEPAWSEVRSIRANATCDRVIIGRGSPALRGDQFRSSASGMTQFL